jgi:pantetheine-phosphate adenylyltransferase
MKKIAIYAGSFDPITVGHVDIISRASKMFDEVLVVVASNSNKQHYYNSNCRVGMVYDALKESKIDNVSVSQLIDKLLIDVAIKTKANFLVRGLRANTDFEYELQIAHANRKLAPEIETVWLPTRVEYSFYSSSMVREIFRLGGDVSEYVLPITLETMQR